MKKRDEKTTHTEELLEMVEFVPYYNYFEFGNKMKHQSTELKLGLSFPRHTLVFLWNILKLNP